MSLSPEDKKRQYQAELRARGNMRKAEKLFNLPFIGLFGGVLLLVMVVGLLFYGFGKSPEIFFSARPQTKRIPRGNYKFVREFHPSRYRPFLNARVRFNGRGFEIWNINWFHWHKVRFEINPGLPRGGYIMQAKKIFKGRKYFFSLNSFRTEDGRTLSSDIVQPLRILIVAETSEGIGGWTGEYSN